MRFGSRSCAPRRRMTALCMEARKLYKKAIDLLAQANMMRRSRILKARWRFGKGG